MGTERIKSHIIPDETGTQIIIITTTREAAAYPNAEQAARTIGRQRFWKLFEIAVGVSAALFGGVTALQSAANVLFSLDKPNLANVIASVAIAIAGAYAVRNGWGGDEILESQQIILGAIEPHQMIHFSPPDHSRD